MQRYTVISNMKVFILLAIIFFSWRVFSAEDHYYDSRYHKIEDYIRFQDDPGYQAYLNEQRAEARVQRVGVNEYFNEREREAQIQERHRQQHLVELANMPQETDLTQLEVAHEKEKALEEKRNAIAAQEYLYQRDMEMAKVRPSRMIASVFETVDDQPRKRVPRDKRKYMAKPKPPSRK